MIIGIDVGGTQVKYGLFDDNGELLHKWAADTVKGEDGNEVIPTLVSALLNELKDKEITIDEITAVGMGVPCPITRDGYLCESANMGWKRPRNIADEFEMLCGIRPVVGNDANVATLGEAWKGAAQNHDNVVMLTLGTGIGAGVISNGMLLYGAHGAAGEIGHMHVEDDETDICGCGKCGCLEQMSSANGVVRICKRELAKKDWETVIDKNNITSKEIFDAYKENDEFAVYIVDIFAKYLARALCNTSMVVDPDIFVIGGGVSKAGEVILQPVIDYYKEFMPFTQCKNNDFVLATLGNDAGIYGAAKLAGCGGSK